MQTDGTPASTTIQNRRIVGEADVQHVAPAGERGRVEARVHPPHQQVAGRALRVGLAEGPLRAPLAEAEHDRLELTPGVREQVLAVQALDEPGPLELA